MATPRIGVIGAGIVGLAMARRLQQKLQADVTVIDKEKVVAAHQTGHNSNVVHSGVYYPPGSLKATLCRRGVGLLRDYCVGRGLRYDELGKVIVAVRHDELPRLNDLAKRAVANGIPDTRLIDRAQLREREPHVEGLAALLIPSTAVVSFPAIAAAMRDDITDAGGELRLGCRVVGIDSRDGKMVVATDVEDMTFDHVVVCAGLQSSMIAAIAGAPRDPEIIPFRGEYYELVPSRSELVRGLVYPVPDPRYPFLGVHFTRGVDGHVHVGPNAVLALAQEGYRWRDVNVRQLWRSVSYPGMRRLARHHWRMGATEVLGSMSKSVFLRRARAYIPELRSTDIVRAESGVRAQALQADGNLVDDFVIHHRPGITFVRNAPSPAATASLAIAEHIVDANDWSRS
ncbi:L-2-hydroxyglutarate oxidase [Mycolicibacterium goodii]|uniref:L-2-hydroxyglutarate oxidase n=1 Tax=Mycolicibacterium goodii TaxID=134601 RepID=UPI001BDD3F6A|nr:L-2-hydroxyglutarate oxidase [Mycolicibacterium goodii]MBU8830472.1 L-2-hydroxyglutarate oxidase [Mycolicibacterium goodii]